MITYMLELDLARDGSYGHALADVTARVLRLEWNQGMSEPEQEFAPPARCRMVLDNHDGALSQDQAGAAYHGLLSRGVHVRLRATHQAVTRTLWIGKISAVQVTPGAVANEEGTPRTVTLDAEDPMTRLMQAEFTPALLQNVRVDAALSDLFESGAAAWPYEESYWVLDYHALGSAKLFQNTLTAFEQAQTTLPWVGDNLDRGAGTSAHTYLSGLVATEAGGRFWWDARSAVFRFHHRHHDALTTTPLLTLTEADLTGAASAYADDIANAVTVHYEPRSTGAAGTTLWEANAFTLRPAQSRSLTARFAVDGEPAGALTVITPLAGLDVMAVDDETGADVTEHLGLSYTSRAASALVTVTNHDPRRVRVTHLRLRGTPIVSGKREWVLAQDAASIAAYDRHEQGLQLPVVDDPEFATDIARARLARHATPRTRFTHIRFIAQGSDSLAAAGLDRTVGDRIAVSEAWSGHAQPYIIAGERHHVDARLRQHHVTWVLKMAARDPYFILQTSALDSADVLSL